MNIVKWAAAALSAFAISASAQSPTQLQPQKANSAILSSAPAPATSATPNATPALTKTDVDAWLDGFMPYALKAADIPGAVVVVVKDGQPLTMRGFGYSDVAAQKPVDPTLTLFRPGSVSKLFTWTSVMQLVQAGKLNLDTDVNQYLDFKIPPKYGKPITLRYLMTHTAGFEETAKYLIEFDKKPVPLRYALSRWIPDRIYAPGTMPAYSNYGASLAGYIVQRVSGEPFEQYVQHHIFQPLGMTHSTFEQPLPDAMKPFMSKSYEYGSPDPKRYEVIPLSPAGALASTGEDMGKFMIAQLNNGGPILNPQTAKLMHSPANHFYSALPPMALGFYHEDRNGLDIVGHGGDTIYFHSDLHLFLDKNVGLYVSMNSPGKDTAVHPLRQQLFEDFTDRYFPATAQNLPTTSTAMAHGQALSGHYVSSRAGGFNWTRLLALFGETKVGVDSHGILTASTVTDPSGAPSKWREVGPWLWQEVNGKDELEAVVDGNGNIKMFSITPYAPIIEFLPAPASLNSGWILPVGGIALLIIIIAALGWPIVALTRRRFKYVPETGGRALRLHCITRATAWLYIILLVGWVFMLSLIQNDLTALNGGMDIWMRLLQLVLIVAIIGTIGSIWNAYSVTTAPGRHKFASAWAILIALALIIMGYLSLDMGLLTASLNF